MNPFFPLVLGRFLAELAEGLALPLPPEPKEPPIRPFPPTPRPKQ